MVLTRERGSGADIFAVRRAAKPLMTVWTSVYVNGLTVEPASRCGNRRKYDLVNLLLSDRSVLDNCISHALIPDSPRDRIRNSLCSSYTPRRSSRATRHIPCTRQSRRYL